MSTSSQFAVAVHVLTLLEHQGGGPLTSDYIAGSVNTNPGFIRRVVARLGRAGLVTSRLGAGGGIALGKPGGEIRLADVYRAVKSGDVFALHHSRPNRRCPVGKHIERALRAALRPAERALEDRLQSVSVADILDSVAPRPR